MHTFATDLDRIAFLLEADADLQGFLGLTAEGATREAPVDGATEELPEGERPKYVTNYIGSKQKLVEWIWKHTPEGVASVLDGFSGSAVVAYMYKTKGLRVVANDRLRYAYHAARAIVENDGTRISSEELNALLKPNGKAGTLVRDKFKGLFFADGVHAIIDQVRANIDALSGYKKDIALFALGKTCMSGKGGFGHFSSSTDYGKRQDTPDEFKERFAKNVARINALVFDNGKECKANQQDINALLPEVKVELAYFDPPYATEFSTTNYEKSYHFVEGLMTYWDGLEINEDSKTHHYVTDHQTVTKANANTFFATFLGNAKHIPHWLISYRDHAYPNETEMRSIIADIGKDVSLRSHDHHYSISSRHGDASNAKEYLFICAGENAAKADDAADTLVITGDDDDLALLSCMAGATDDDPVRVTGYMGSKYIMLGWIARQVPKEAKSVLDAFSGGANVAYHFKRQGLQVFANDLLRYPYHLARAVVENSTETLTDEDIERILAPNADAGDFIVRTFHGYYYSKPVLAWLDQVWANIQKLPGYKKDLALATLGTTVKAKSAFGQFNRSKKNSKASLDTDAGLSNSQLTNVPVSEFVATFKATAKRLNGLVFDNGTECKAFNLDAVEAVRKLGADALYLDPPYITSFNRNDYENDLHFVEGLMTRWADKEILDNGRRNYPSRTTFTRESMQELMASLARESRGKYSTVLLSYRDKAYPDETEIGRIFGEHYGLVRKRAMDVEYNMARSYGAGGQFAKELLFISSKPRQTAKASQADFRPANCHTSVPVDIHLSTAGQVTAPGTGDPRFTCILCRVGTNKNGDHFLAEELASRYVTAVNKKVDLQHSQDVTDIVGGIVGSDYIEDETGGRVECVGELFVQDAPNAQLAYRLMKAGIITQVSMECDYSEGECSVCGKRVASKNDYCLHLRKYKGGDFQGQPVYEILHGVTFTGLGLLDRKGADENARITQVASREAAISEGAPMDQDIRDAAESDAAKKTTPPAGGDAPPANDAERVKALEKENQQLKQQVLDLQKQVDELLAAQKAAANRTKAQTLVRKLERQGLKFGTDEEKEIEIGRLAGLSDEAFAASEAAYGRMAQALPGKTDAADKSSQADQTDCACDNTKAADQVTPPLKTDAGVRPLDVDDRNESLEDQLKRGFQQAYDERIARTQA
jgi:adenine-specific DNA-methyltransferase